VRIDTQDAIQPVDPATRRLDLDRLNLRVEQLDRFEGTERGHIAVEIHINGEHLPTYATDPAELSRSVLESREFFFNTCSCGSPQCVDIWNGIHVRHEPGIVAWYIPLEFKGSGDTGRRLHERVYRFAWAAYRAEIIRCLQCLIETAHRLPDAVLTMHGFEASKGRALSDDLLKTDAQRNADGRAPHKRLDDAVEACDEASARCALADGADLLTLLDDEGESRWERAVFLHGAGGEWQRKFVRTLADYFATPIPAESYPEILLKQIVEEGHAELLYQMTVPGGPLALTDPRAEVCRAQLVTLRSERQRDQATNGIGDVGEWEEELNRRRDLLEIDMKIEALDRSIQMLHAHRIDDGFKKRNATEIQQL
jgi:hypothetical protein